ncbi:unnamed protein product [Acanthoscelides obtectus]|uniref:Uncharacterized protein n=1 Tax=Acanthoscelides obtectus TaxID=200917 RepID=A0A9P0Q3V9_ACAOB|nr:unnamed protein product [Acanthoscelides obtectus]CAK1636106.1 hypothetical protein AOBTE_LOCUS9747 [Acanthoscelides obtectus]
MTAIGSVIVCFFRFINQNSVKIRQQCRARFSITFNEFDCYIH